MKVVNIKFVALVLLGIILIQGRLVTSDTSNRAFYDKVVTVDTSGFSSIEIIVPKEYNLTAKNSWVYQNILRTFNNITGNISSFYSTIKFNESEVVNSFSGQSWFKFNLSDISLLNNPPNIQYDRSLFFNYSKLTTDTLKSEGDDLNIYRIWFYLNGSGTIRLHIQAVHSNNLLSFPPNTVIWWATFEMLGIVIALISVIIVKKRFILKTIEKF